MEIENKSISSSKDTMSCSNFMKYSDVAPLSYCVQLINSIKAPTKYVAYNADLIKQYSALYSSIKILLLSHFYYKSSDMLVIEDHVKSLQQIFASQKDNIQAHPLFFEFMNLIDSLSEVIIRVKKANDSSFVLNNSME
ncbi:hypothetical protein WA158_001483 [Blastocystis sp. Blastoise]